MANEQAVNFAVQGSEKIKNWFGNYIVTARTLAQVMEGYRRIPAVER